jgi:predicted AAA+ superfamily ATPase
MIKRVMSGQIAQDLTHSNKIVIVSCPRRVGKTTLVRTLIQSLPFRSIEVNADQLRYHEVFSSRDLNRMKSVIGSHDLLFIDEAPNIPDIGINLKIRYDSLPGLKIIATGSSAFELANRLKEPLTGRT